MQRRLVVILIMLLAAVGFIANAAEPLAKERNSTIEDSCRSSTAHAQRLARQCKNRA